MKLLFFPFVSFLKLVDDFTLCSRTFSVSPQLCKWRCFTPLPAWSFSPQPFSLCVAGNLTSNEFQYYVLAVDHVILPRLHMLDFYLFICGFILCKKIHTFKILNSCLAHVKCAFYKSLSHSFLKTCPVWIPLLP